MTDGPWLITVPFSAVPHRTAKWQAFTPAMLDRVCSAYAFPAPRYYWQESQGRWSGGVDRPASNVPTQGDKVTQIACLLRD